VEQKEAEDKHLPVIECIRSEGSSQNVKEPASSIAALTEKIVEETTYRVHVKVFPNTKYLSVRSWSVVKVSHTLLLRKFSSPFVLLGDRMIRGKRRRDSSRHNPIPPSYIICRRLSR
jgi:hypothetical protein